MHFSFCVGREIILKILKVEQCGKKEAFHFRAKLEQGNFLTAVLILDVPSDLKVNNDKFDVLSYTKSEKLTMIHLMWGQ